MMKYSKFELLDQTICSIKLTKNNFFINTLLSSHVIGFAVKEKMNE